MPDPGGAGPAARRPGRELVEVAPGVHVTTAEHWTTTTTVLVARDGGCLVVDPALTVGDLAGLAEALRERRWVVEAGFATHPHWDHVLWATALGDVPRWATPECAAVAARDPDALLRAAADEGAPGHDPGLVGRLAALDGSVLPWSRPAVAVAYAGHAAGSAALLLPDAGVLAVGDVLSDVEVPLLDLASDDPLRDHHAGLDRLEAVAAEHAVEVLVPGHGHVTDAAGLRRRLAADRAYLDRLAARQPVEDPRLADAWVRGEHERQSRWLADH